MLFSKFYDELYERLFDALSLITDTESDPVKRLAKSLQVLREDLLLLRDKVLSRPFPDKATEILFFKMVKPKFYALKVFHFELYNLDIAKPVGTLDTLLDYYRQELKLVERFFKLNAFLYHYYKSGFSEMDNLYFRRGAEVPAVLVPDKPDTDPEYSTNMDDLFARFIAFEMLRAEILRRIQGLDGSLVPGGSLPDKPVPRLKWTGSHVNLVELVYGLYYTGQLNNGDADVMEIVGLIEVIFQVKLRDAHHSFVEIRRRKVISPSRFIEQMAAAIQQRVEDDLAYKPKK